MTHRDKEKPFVDDGWDSVEGIHLLSHEAMAATFRIFVVHEDAEYARQAAHAAFDEVDRLEARLSRYIENSDVSQINNLRPGEKLVIGLDAFNCLKCAAEIYRQSGGTFDVTIGHLLGAWRNSDKTMRIPSEEELKAARSRTGMGLLKLDEETHTVEVPAGPLLVDLGGIGKGYAVDRIGELLKDWDIRQALVSGGYSTVLAADAPDDKILEKMKVSKKGWPLTLSDPRNRQEVLFRVCLGHRAISGSGLEKGGHIIDPRTAQPVRGTLAAWACAPDATTADALSTAFMVMSPEEVRQYSMKHGEMPAMVMREAKDMKTSPGQVLRFGRWDDIICS